MRIFIKELGNLFIYVGDAEESHDHALSLQIAYYYEEMREY